MLGLLTLELRLVLVGEEFLIVLVRVLPTLLIALEEVLRTFLLEFVAALDNLRVE